MYTLAILAHLRPRLAYPLGHCGHALSHGGRQPAEAKPPLNTCTIRVTFHEHPVLGEHLLEIEVGRTILAQAKLVTRSDNKVPVPKGY